MTKIFKFLLPISIILVLLFFIPAIFVIKKTGFYSESITNLLPLTTTKGYQMHLTNQPIGTTSIRVALKNPSLQNNSHINVDILDSSGTTIREMVFSGANIGDPSWVQLDFPLLSLTDYDIRLTTDNQNDQSLYIYANSSSNFNLITFYKTSHLINRLSDNYTYQLKQITQRSIFHIFSYLSLILILQYFLFKSFYDPKIKK